MADKATKGGTDSASPAQGRITVSIPGDVATLLKAKQEALAAALKEAHGVSVDLSPAQVVESILRDALSEPAGETPAA